MSEIPWSWRGRIRYEDALEQQRAHRGEVIAGTAGEVIWLLEHDSVITTGRRPVSDLPSPEVLSALKTRVVTTERGGLATWHGPGQLIAYAIMDAWGRGLGARGAIRAMEEGVMAYLQTLGISSDRRTGHPGVWAGRDKVCAIGMHFRRGVSMHGIALNLAPDLSGFGLILPCGITDGGVTSVAHLLGTAPTAQSAAPGLGQALQSAITRATGKKPPPSDLKHS